MSLMTQEIRITLTEDQVRERSLILARIAALDRATSGEVNPQKQPKIDTATVTALVADLIRLDIPINSPFESRGKMPLIGRLLDILYPLIVSTAYSEEEQMEFRSSISAIVYHVGLGNLRSEPSYQALASELDINEQSIAAAAADLAASAKPAEQKPVPPFTIDVVDLSPVVHRPRSLDRLLKEPENFIDLYQAALRIVEDSEVSFKGNYRRWLLDSLTEQAELLFDQKQEWLTEYKQLLEYYFATIVAQYQPEVLENVDKDRVYTLPRLVLLLAAYESLRHVSEEIMKDSEFTPMIEQFEYREQITRASMKQLEAKLQTTTSITTEKIDQITLALSARVFKNYSERTAQQAQQSQEKGLRPGIIYQLRRKITGALSGLRQVA
jgi:hypothetical protein